MKKIIIVLTWLFVLLLTLGLSIRTLQIGNRETRKLSTSNIDFQATVPNNFYQVYASLPQTADSFRATIIPIDARADIVKQYLQKHKSPIEPYSDTIIATSEQYKTEQVDDLWRYIIAIAQCESNLGVKIPEGSYNAWGLGIPTGAKQGLTYKNWEEGITAVAKFLTKLVDKGLITPEDWAPTYAPPSIENGGSWAKCVRHFLNDLQ